MFHVKHLNASYPRFCVTHFHVLILRVQYIAVLMRIIISN